MSNNKAPIEESMDIIYDDDITYDDITNDIHDITIYDTNTRINNYINALTYLLYNSNYINPYINTYLNNNQYINQVPMTNYFNINEFDIQLNNIQYNTIIEFLNSFH